MFADGKRGGKLGGTTSAERKLQNKLEQCQAELTECARIGGKRKLCTGKNGCDRIRPLIWFTDKGRPHTCIMCRAPSFKFRRLQEPDWEARTIGELSCRNLAEDTSAVDSCIQQDIFIILCICDQQSIVYICVHAGGLATRTVFQLWCMLLPTGTVICDCIYISLHADDWLLQGAWKESWPQPVHTPQVLQMIQQQQQQSSSKRTSSQMRTLETSKQVATCRRVQPNLVVSYLQSLSASI